MTKCVNCGHESHCGVTLKKTLSSLRAFRNFSDDAGSQEIEVCKNCSCDSCTE